VDAPPTGWVTALAGLLARGSWAFVRPSQFPSGRVGRKPHRSQLRGQPRIGCKHAAAVFPLSSPVRTGEPARWNVHSAENFCQGI